MEQVRKQREEECIKEAERKADVEKIEEVLVMETDPLEGTEAGMKDFEDSICSLDLQLQRFEMEKMKEKTDSAKKVMSYAG